jgi:TRAP-type C4-dicarboxylate transport system permease small subunit
VIEPADQEPADEPFALRLLGRSIDGALVLLGAAIILLVLNNVAVHALFNADVAFTTELTEFLLVWATFIGGAAAVRRGAHMRVGELVEMARPGLRRWLEVAIQALVLVVLVVLIVQGTAIAERTMDQQMTVLYWPTGLQYAALPIGSALAVPFVLRNLYRLLRPGVATSSGA